MTLIAMTIALPEGIATTLLTVMLTAAGSIILGFGAWMYRVDGKLTRIDLSLKHASKGLGSLRRRHGRMLKRHHEHEKNIALMKKDIEGLSGSNPCIHKPGLEG